jgi:hypothetical protein
VFVEGGGHGNVPDQQSHEGRTAQLEVFRHGRDSSIPQPLRS